MSVELEEIQSQLAEICELITDRGYFKPDATLHIEVNGVGLIARASTTQNGSIYDKETEAPWLGYITGETIQDAIDNTRSAILKSPTVLDTRRDALRRKLGKMIDESRDLEMGIDFINPLEESMKRLSENAIAAE